ncbi:MAG: CYTH and CHAD domain-containing protein [Candidatus Dormibacteraeota bacterium]|nr:CYTH and CHAD domain-containing protein [Candidatus Dormibacteraeota bacterium]
MAERRVTLAAPPAFHLPPLDDAARAWVVGDEVEQRLESVYWDTVDLRLARWDCSLRHRSGEGWTLYVPGLEGARAPLTFDGSARRPPESAVALVRAYARRAPLQPVARLSTWRRTLPLLDESGQTRLTVVDDEVSILQGRRVAARFRELAVVAAEEESLTDVVVARLNAAGAAVTRAIPNHIRALGSIASVPEVSRLPLSPAPRAAEVVTAAIAAAVTTLMRRDPGVRLGGDPEDVHQARVALRRLRSHLRTFKALVEPEWSARVRQETGWLAGELGGVRDREVLLERLETEIAGLDPGDQRVGRELTERLRTELERARAELRSAFESDRYLDLVELLIDAARHPRLTEEASAPASELLPALVRRPWRALRRDVQALPSNPPDEALHRVRILAKRARYAAEAAAVVIGQPAAKFAKRAAALQTVLGEHQDSVVAREWIRAAAGRGGRAFAAGVLYGLEVAHAQQARSEWPAAWKKLSKRKRRTWMA